VTFNARRTFVGLILIGIVGAAALPIAIYFIGLAVAPPPPTPASTAVAPLVAEAIWARAEGGTATALTPVTHLSMARFVGCVAIEDFYDTTPGDAQRVSACREYMPALQGVEYLAGLQMRDAGLKTSFGEGLGRFSTLVWVTHSWTKAEFLNTLAERGEFGAGVRGAETASRRYFGRAGAELTLPQAALLAAFIGDRTSDFDPWCGPAGAVAMRGRILQRMRDNRSIDDAALSAANTSGLQLGPPPADHKPCRD
jgi:hypothetical protein